MIFLGVGGWISKPTLGHTSILVEEESEKLLLDAGEGTARAVYLYGGGLLGLRAIVVTHLHGDHVLGLPTILMLLKYMKAPRIRVYVPNESSSDLEELFRITGVDYKSVTDIINVMHGEEHEVGLFKLRFIKAVHTVPSLSIRVEAKDKCVVYSGDTAYNPDLVELARGCNTLVHEVSGYDPISHMYGHSTFEDVFKIAEKAGVERVILVHYYLDIPYLKPTDIKTSIIFSLAYPGYEVVV